MRPSQNTGNGDTGGRQDHAEQVEEAPPADRRQDAKTDAAKYGQQHAGHRQLTRCRKAVQDLGGHLFVRLMRPAEVAGEQILKEGPKLLEEGPIQSELVAQICHVLGACPLAEHDLRRVAGYEIDHQKNEHRDADHGRHQQCQSLQYKGLHS